MVTTTSKFVVLLEVNNPTILDSLANRANVPAVCASSNVWDQCVDLNMIIQALLRGLDVVPMQLVLM